MNANVMCILRLYDPYMRIYNRWREGVVDRGMYPALRTRAAIRRWPAIGARTLRTRFAYNPIMIFLFLLCYERQIPHLHAYSLRMYSLTF